MARKRTVEPDPEDLRKDLLAAMAAARELGPEMDSALVDAHLRRHYGPEALEAPRAVQPAPRVERSPAQTALYLQTGLAALAIVAVVLAVAVWHAFPLLFFLWPLFAFGAFGRRRRWGRGGYRYGYGRRWDDGREDWPDGAGRRDDGLTEIADNRGVGRGRVVSAGEII
jgi:hypothetical protein